MDYRGSKHPRAVQSSGARNQRNVLGRTLLARQVFGSATVLLGLVGVIACSDSDSKTTGTTDTPTDGGAGGAPDTDNLTGEQLFKQALPGTNGRACATCHVPEDNFTLTPDHVAKLFETDPQNPLFSAIDADDPTAEELTFEHLKRGLVRVWLPLPDNVDLLNDEGAVITPTDRKLFVWRGVPSIADAALTAPFQRDGRMGTLEDQAQGAITAHSEGLAISESQLERIAQFERGIFSSDRARRVAEYIAGGGDPLEAPQVDDELELSAPEQRGRDLYEAVCANCHGGLNKATIVGRKIHDLAFPALKSDGSGTLLYEVPATDPPTVILARQPNNEFVNIATSFEMYLAVLGATEHESFTQDVGFPNYRYRFYTDGTRTEIAADLPPAAPPFDPNGGGGFNVEVDGDGNPLVGPNFVPQFFSTDPGRAMITGDPQDFEAFDVPTLRGIANTAPYFHNNTVQTLEEVVNLYSDHLLSRFPSLIQPGEKELDPDGDIGVEEIFTADQKKDLVAFLKRL
jgi:cytochrome c peroxidase